MRISYLSSDVALPICLDIATLTLEQMAARGATDIEAWIGPHVCGRCDEVPEAMRDEVSRSVPQSYSTTSWGTPALAIGAGVAAHLERPGSTEEQRVGNQRSRPCRSQGST